MPQKISSTFSISSADEQFVYLWGESNSQVLKQQVDKVLGLDKEVQDISGNVATLTSQVTKLIESQQQYAKNNLPDSQPKITGAT